MNILSVENLSKSFSDKVLFENISFGIARGEKIALIARNGSGKTTLLRILAGNDVPDSGKVTMRKGIRIDYLEQDPQTDPSKTVLETIFDDNNPSAQLMRQYEDVLEKVNCILLLNCKLNSNVFLRLSIWPEPGITSIVSGRYCLS